ncbi:MAG: heme-binding domain-containing protein [Vicinamibacterales bacterium]
MSPRPGRVLLWVVVVILAAFAAAQFFPVDRTTPPVDPSRAIGAHLAVPQPVADILERSCRDCHSYATRWPWYVRVAPASWFMAGHVREAREHMNLSEWGTYDRGEMSELLGEMCGEVRERNMPLPSYLLLHRGARLSDADIELLCGWTEEARRALGEAGR